MRHHIGSDLLGRAVRIVAPVVGIDLVAHADVAHILCKLERTYLIFGVGLLVNGVRRAEQHGVNPQAAGEQALGQVQLQLHEGGRDVAYIGMRESVVPDLVTFVVNPAGNGRKFVCLEANEKEGCGCVFAL